jgi:hypothetical protein
MTKNYGCLEDDIAHYTCYRTREPLTVDGRLAEAAWRKAPKSPRFVDMVTDDPVCISPASVWMKLAQRLPLAEAQVDCRQGTLPW